ncbi:MAG: hypothetical protein IT186_15600 [Acidobacteria bacterium]|nr:hypothetical protein [Acidobacteriota bacterium]
MKAFGIYHWDTFDDHTTIQIGSADSVEEAIEFVQKEYGPRIRPNGADRVDIVDVEKGVVVKRFTIG